MRKYFIHGSEDSIDTDIYVIVDDIPDFKTSVEICKSYKSPFNANLLKIDNGQVSWCFKGTEDECNNSLLSTYHLHKQTFPCPINKKAERDYALKTIRTIRGLLSYLSRTEYREEVKNALKSSDLFLKLSVLENIPFSKITDFSKNDIKEVYKFFAFQLGQTMALIKEDKELFTKNDVIKHYPEFQDYLKRIESDGYILEKHLKLFIKECKERFILQGDTLSHYAFKKHEGYEFICSKEEKKLPPVVVFDLDETLYSEKHRSHLREEKKLSEYFSKCGEDKVIKPTLELLKKHIKEGYEIWLVSGRYAPEALEGTLNALKRDNVPYHNLKLRGENNFVPDFVIKPSWCKRLIGLERVHIIYDDQDIVLEGFRKKGFKNVVDIKPIISNYDLFKKNKNFKP